MQDEGGSHMPSATGRLHRSAQEVQGWRSSQVEKPKKGGGKGSLVWKKTETWLLSFAGGRQFVSKG